MTVTPSPQSVVVPREPSEEMMLAGALVGPDTNNGQFGYDDARTVFVAMLAAAPAPSSLAGGEVRTPDRHELAAIALDTGIAIGVSTWPDEQMSDALTVTDAILAALSPEAPAREMVALDKRIADAAERDRRERDKAFRGESYEPLTPRHEAPAELLSNPQELAPAENPVPSEWTGQGTDDDFFKPIKTAFSKEAPAPTCQKCGGEVQGWTCQECGASFRENDEGSLVFAKHEAPASEGDAS